MLTIIQDGKVTEIDELHYLKDGVGFIYLTKQEGYYCFRWLNFIPMENPIFDTLETALEFHKSEAFSRK